jgi:hypothetical protein
MLISMITQPQGENYMATWQEVSTVLTSGIAFKGEMVNDSLVKTLLEMKDGRSQLVWVGHIGGNVVLSSVVCKIDEVNLTALFTGDILNNIVYGLSSIGEHLVVRDVTPLENLNANELAQPLVALAVFGDILEAAITGKDTY